MTWREEFPELAEALDKVGPGASVKDLGMAIERRLGGRPKGSKNKYDAMSRVGRTSALDPSTEYMRVAGYSDLGGGSWRATQNKSYEEDNQGPFGSGLSTLKNTHRVGGEEQAESGASPDHKE